MSATCKRLPDTYFMLGWATITSPNSTKKTYAMEILAKPEHYSVMQELAMQMGEESSNIYPIIQRWIATPATGRTREE